jgi:hypothetical protein
MAVIVMKSVSWRVVFFTRSFHKLVPENITEHDKGSFKMIRSKIYVQGYAVNQNDNQENAVHQNGIQQKVINIYGIQQNDIQQNVI